MALEKHLQPALFCLRSAKNPVSDFPPERSLMEETMVRPAWAEGLHERQVEAVLYAGEHGRITAGAHRALVGISDVTAYRDLKDLWEKELLVRHGKRRGTYYALAG